MSEKRLALIISWAITSAKKGKGVVDRGIEAREEELNSIQAPGSSLLACVDSC